MKQFIFAFTLILSGFNLNAACDDYVMTPNGCFLEVFCDNGGNQMLIASFHLQSLTFIQNNTNRFTLRDGNGTTFGKSISEVSAFVDFAALSAFLTPLRDACQSGSGGTTTTTSTTISASDSIQTIQLQALESVTICKCDDLNGDSTELAVYVEAYNRTVTPTGITSTFIGNYTNGGLLNIYTPANPVDCSGVGEEARESWNSFELNGPATWSPSELMTSGTIRVVSGSPVWDGPDEAPRTLITSETLSFGSSMYLTDPSTILTLLAGDSVVITYTKLN